MYVNPFFDPSILSDEEITKQISDLNRRSMIASWSMRSPLAMDQINSMIDALQEERINRLNKQSAEAYQAMFPDVIESDPDCKAEKSEKSEPQVRSQVVQSPQTPKKFDNIPIFHKEYVKPKPDPAPPKPAPSTDETK